MLGDREAEEHREAIIRCTASIELNHMVKEYATLVNIVLTIEYTQIIRYSLEVYLFNCNY